MTESRARALDAGMPFPVWATGGPSGEPCEHGVWVEPDYGHTTATEVAVALRRMEKEGAQSVRAYGHRVTAVVDVETGRVTAKDQGAEQLLRAAPWFGKALAKELELLRRRARRSVAQRDRDAAIRAAVERADASAMVPYDELCAADWDLIAQHQGTSYWITDHHCLKRTCRCAEIVLDIYELAEPDAKRVGEVRLDLADPRAEPEPSSPLAGEVFERFWATGREELLRRHQAVSRAIESLRARPSVAVGRNAPCPCGSGKKQKRCCAG